MSNENLPNDGNNTWSEYKRLVLMELERLNLAIDTIKEKLSDVDKKISKDIIDSAKEISELMKNLETETIEKIHKIDIRLNTIETKTLLIATVASFAIGGIIQFVIKSLGN